MVTVWYDKQKIFLQHFSYFFFYIICFDISPKEKNIFFVIRRTMRERTYFYNIRKIYEAKETQ